AERYPRRRGERMSLFSSATLVGRSVAPFAGGILLTIASFQAVYLVCAISAGLALLIALFIPKDIPSYQVELNTHALSQIQTIQGLREVVGNFQIMVTSSMEAAQFFVYGAVEIFLILYANSIGLEDLQLGIIAGIPIVVAGITKPIMGHLSDRVGRKSLIVAGFVVGAVVVAMYQAFTSFLALSLISLSFGISFATVTSSTSAFVADACKENSFGAALGVLSTIMDIGQVAGPPIIGIIVWKYGYGATFTVLGGVLLVAGLIFLITIKNHKGEQMKPNN
ncbi:MAG: MFS transporter, partial [Candidatus Hodarchaeota archaeon]